MPSATFNNNSSNYQACVLRKGDVEIIGWVPVKMVEQGAMLRMKRDGQWDDGWLIYQPKMSFIVKGVPDMFERIEND